jgi:GcrA cell cycle regulator
VSEVVRHGVTWTSELAERLRQLWLEQKLSASQLAGVFGVTRNAILGKVFRLGLIGTRKPNTHPDPERHRETRWAPKPASKPQSKPTPILTDDIDMQDEQAFLGIKLFNLTKKQCRYPHGEAVPYAFCGQPIREGSSYCPHHHRLAYHPAQPSRRDRYYVPSSGRTL